MLILILTLIPTPTPTLTLTLTLTLALTPALRLSNSHHKRMHADVQAIIAAVGSAQPKTVVVMAVPGVRAFTANREVVC